MRKSTGIVLTTALLLVGCTPPEWKVKQDKAIKESTATIFITSGKYSLTYYTKSSSIEFLNSTCIKFLDLESEAMVQSCAPYTIKYK